MDPVLVELDHFLRDTGAFEKLAPLVARLIEQLNQSPAQPQVWEALPTYFFDVSFPADIVSCWLFVLRGGERFPNERHPNSWQRSIALRGQALFEVYEDGRWQERPLNGAGVTGGERAISIPPNTWHRIAIGPEPLVSLSFHSAPATELIEETCVGDDLTQTHRRVYGAEPHRAA